MADKKKPVVAAFIDCNRGFNKKLIAYAGGDESRVREAFNRARKVYGMYTHTIYVKDEIDRMDGKDVPLRPLPKEELIGPETFQKVMSHVQERREEKIKTALGRHLNS